MQGFLEAFINYKRINLFFLVFIFIISRFATYIEIWNCLFRSVNSWRRSLIGLIRLFLENFILEGYFLCLHQETYFLFFFSFPYEGLLYRGSLSVHKNSLKYAYYISCTFHTVFYTWYNYRNLLIYLLMLQIYHR